ncbi:MAG TPA: T9SS type A sorting domain-containing protein [Lentimicrobium sp.]|nr:T9SS type A sorting domain-containing protein [Lentimicrobium sp.]
MKQIFATLTALLLFISLSGQTTFQKSYGFYYSAFPDLVFSQDDGYLMALVSFKDKYYMSFVKTDLNGDTLWTKDVDAGLTYGSQLYGNDDQLGNIYIYTGHYKLFKFDKNANLKWEKSLTDPIRKFFVKDNILWGCSHPYHGNYLYKFDATTGDSLWRSQIFNYDPEIWLNSDATSIVATNNGNVVITISYINPFEGFPMQTKFFLFPANSTEPVSFTFPYNKDFVVRESKSIGNDIISIASNVGYNVDDNICYFIKYSSDGTLQTFSEKHFGYPEIGLFKLVITQQNEVVAMGNSITQTYPNLMLHCFSMNGDSLWTQFPGNTDLWAGDIKLAADGGFILTGSHYRSSDDTPYLIKTSPLGTLNAIHENNPLQAVVYPNPASDFITFNTPSITSGKLIIMDATGKICARKDITSNKTTWYCKFENPGVYFYQIINEKQSLTGKFVVN